MEHNQRRTVTSNHLTVIAYTNMKGIKPNQYHAPSVGKKATKLCREQDLAIGSVVDSRYGLINTYPVEILDQVFSGKKGGYMKRYELYLDDGDTVVILDLVTGSTFATSVEEAYQYYL